MSSNQQAQTIPAFLLDTVARRADEPALGFILGGELFWRTWREVFDEAADCAGCVQAAGIAPGDCVAQVAENRYEWIITDLALHLVGAVHVPVHVSLAGEQIAAQIADCGARLVFVSTEELRAKFADLLDQRVTVLVHETARPQMDVKFAPREACDDELATILYTSGTTGRPRGVMLSQGNLASNAAAAADAFAADESQVRLNILPLSHIYARTCDLYTWVYRGCRLVLGEGRDTLARDCQLVRPTALNAVPYLYQKIADRVRAASEDAEAEDRNLRAFFGGQIENLCSGGAPLAPDVEQWFAERDLPILVGYGLTEASPVITASTPAAHRRGCVGRPLSDVQVRIADDGEIITRGPHVMRGYWRNEEDTADAIRDGWLHTGDLGHIDDDGYLSIRGRKKELIVLCTGKKVHPTRVESLLTASPLIEQAVVFGEGKSSLVALIVPSSSAFDGSEDPPKGYPARSEKIGQEISRVLQSAAHEEQIWKFALLDRAFSVEQGELTPKLSLCRSVIADHFSRVLEQLYGGVSAGHSQEAQSPSRQPLNA
jgi:long-chain acyl-CoA synthetase